MQMHMYTSTRTSILKYYTARAHHHVHAYGHGTSCNKI